MITDDINHDGHLNVMLVGNSYGADVVTGRYAAHTGWVMTGDGQGNFRAMPHQASDFFADGDCQDIAQVTSVQGDVLYVISQHNGRLLAFAPYENRTAATAE